MLYELNLSVSTDTLYIQKQQILVYFDTKLYLLQNFVYYLEAFEPKLVNCVLNIIGANSLCLGYLYLWLLFI